MWQHIYHHHIKKTHQSYALCSLISVSTAVRLLLLHTTICYVENKGGVCQRANPGSSVSPRIEYNHHVLESISSLSIHQYNNYIHNKTIVVDDSAVISLKLPIILWGYCCLFLLLLIIIIVVTAISLAAWLPDVIGLASRLMGKTISS